MSEVNAYKHKRSKDAASPKRRTGRRPRGVVIAEHTKRAIDEVIRAAGGQRVSPNVYAAVTGLSTQTLANWRMQDMLADRRGEPRRSDRPKWEKFGSSVRYWLPYSGDSSSAAA